MFQLFLRMVRDLFLPKVLESFWSKAVELTADDAHSSLKNMKDFESSLKTLQTNLKLLSAKASDVEKEIKDKHLSGQKKRKREVGEWLEQVKFIEKEIVDLEAQVESQGFVMRLMDGGKAAKLNEQVENLVERGRDFGEVVLDVCGTSGETLLTDGMVGEEFSKNLGRILNLLETREVSTIGVYGMGGVGKTALAKYVNNQLLQQSEGPVFWVTVSQESTIRSLQDKIARLLGVNLSDEDEEDIRATRLHKALSQEKNSVLILDDVWENIDMKKVGCLFSSRCCRLIITTRSLDVCNQFCCQEVIHVVKLHEGEAWELFYETLGIGIELGPLVENIARSVAKLCGGLPLAIITTAGSMRSKSGIHKWKNAFTELQERVLGQDSMSDGDEVFKVLQCSFDRLKKRNDKRTEFNTIQRCFLYCSLYPEDHKINREDLVRKFISVGLVSERKRRRARVHYGHSILDKLVNVCLLESCIDDEGGKCVKMHDLVRGMALKIGEEKYLVRAGDHSLKKIYAPDEEEWTKDVEMASLVKCDIRRIEEGVSPDCPKLSTLLLWENYGLGAIPDSFFSKMQGLCTLDLGRTPITMLPNSVSDMTRLKALLLEGCEKLETVPNLGKLKALKELNLSGTAIKEVPQGVEELSNLRFFSIDAPGLKLFPKGLLLKLGHLEHLNLPLHMHVDIEEIENLNQLEDFGGGVKNVNDFNRFIRTRVHGTGCRFRIGVNSKNASILRLGKRKRVDLGVKNSEVVLCESNLKDEKLLGKGIVYLTIYGCKGLSKCFVDDSPQRFDNPTLLRKLDIKRCGGIEWILRGDGQISNTLEEIGLFELDDLRGILVMERREIAIGASTTAPTQPAVFFSLKRLSIGNCNKMRKAGLPVHAIPNLESISIWECGEIEEIFEEDDGTSASILTTLPKLTNLKLIGLPRLKKVGIAVTGVPNLEIIHIWGCGGIEDILKEDEGSAASIVTTHTLPKLKWLILSDLPSLKNVSKATIICNSIKYMDIRKCPRLMKKLPLDFDDPTPPPSLGRIQVEREWWESLEWENAELPELLLPLVEFED